MQLFGPVGMVFAILIAAVAGLASMAVGFLLLGASLFAAGAVVYGLLRAFGINEGTANDAVSVVIASGLAGLLLGTPVYIILIFYWASQAAPFEQRYQPSWEHYFTTASWIAGIVFLIGAIDVVRALPKRRAQALKELEER